MVDPATLPFLMSFYNQASAAATVDDCMNE
jgi:hypothetical protein